MASQKKKEKISILFILTSCVLDGVEPLPGSRRSRGTEKQHGHQEIPSIHRQQQIPTVPVGASGQDGEVKYTVDTQDTLNHFSSVLLWLYFRCNPFFVRCIKPNNTKVDVDKDLPDMPTNTVSHDMLAFTSSFRMRVCLKTTWSKVSWVTPASWRRSGSGKKATLLGCRFLSSCSGETLYLLVQP